MDSVRTILRNTLKGTRFHLGISERDRGVFRKETSTLRGLTLFPRTLRSIGDDFSLSQVIGQLGMYGTLINGIQAAALEHVGMRNATWNGATSMFAIPIASAVSQIVVLPSRPPGSLHLWFVILKVPR